MTDTQNLSHYGPSPWSPPAFTGVYWLPAFEILEAAGFNVILINARNAKNVPGRKNDVNDAQWLQKLHSLSLLRASLDVERWFLLYLIDL